LTPSAHCPDSQCAEQVLLTCVRLPERRSGCRQFLFAPDGGNSLFQVGKRGQRHQWLNLLPEQRFGQTGLQPRLRVGSAGFWIDGRPLRVKWADASAHIAKACPNPRGSRSRDRSRRGMAAAHRRSLAGAPDPMQASMKPRAAQPAVVAIGGVTAHPDPVSPDDGRSACANLRNKIVHCPAHPGFRVVRVTGGSGSGCLFR